MDYVKLFEDKALELPNRRLYDDIYSNLTSRQQKTLLNKSRDWYQGNTQKTRIELLAEDSSIILLKEPIYEEVTDLFEPKIAGYKEDTLLNTDARTRRKLKINKSEVAYFKAIREAIK